MTDEERKNRNPAPEVYKTNRSELGPELHAKDLELHHVYVLESQKYMATMNYMGKVHSLDPVTLDAMVLHHFHGPRVGLDIFLKVASDGTLHTQEQKLTIYRYTGPDQ